MKTVLSFIMLNVLASTSFAAIVQSAQLDAEKENILVGVVYGGGCGDHKFSLNLGSCFESYPVQCEAQLTHESNDPCEGLIYKTVVFSLKGYGFNDPYFKGASLKIKGATEWTTKKPSSATVILPK